MTAEMTSLLRQINIEVAVISKDEASQVAVQNAMVSTTCKAEWKECFSNSLLIENIPFAQQHRTDSCEPTNLMDPGQSEKDF